MMHIRCVMVLVVLGGLVALTSCAMSPSAPVTEPWDDEIPWHIHWAATRHAEDRLGREFFHAYYTFREDRSGYYPPDEYCLEHPESCHWSLLESRYRMSYDFAIPEISFVDGPMSFILWPSGEAMSDSTLQLSYGLPDCVSYPIECQFPIDEEDARQIAEDDSLAPGIQEWSMNFGWYAGEFQTYKWDVSNYLAPDHGEGLLIDANTGDILARFWWDITAGVSVRRLRPN